MFMKQVRSHETNHNAGRLFGAALTLGTLIGGLSAEASAGASSPNLHQQTGATMAGIEDGKGTVLPDLYNTYKSGTVLYKTASSSWYSRGEKPSNWRCDASNNLS